MGNVVGVSFRELTLKRDFSCPPPKKEKHKKKKKKKKVLPAHQEEESRERWNTSAT